MPKTKVSLKKSIYRYSLSDIEPSEVDLSFKDLKDSQFRSFFKNQQVSVVHLNLSYNILSLQTLPQANLAWLKLEDLNLNHNYIRSKGVKLFSKVQIPSLKICSLNHNQLSDDVIYYLIRSKWINLTTLNLSQNHITDLGIASLLQGNWPSLRNLFLHQNEMTSIGLRKLTKAFWKELTTLYLYNSKRMHWKSEEKSVQEILELQTMLQECYGKIEKIYL